MSNKLIDLTALQRFLETLDVEGSVPLLTSWSANRLYKVNIAVLYNGQIYVCTEEHTSTPIFDKAKWKSVSGSSLIDTWKPNTKYNKDDIIIENSNLYICTNTHISPTKFTEENWKNLSSGSGAGNYSQETKLDVVAPINVDLSIQQSKEFCFPPVTVLKLSDALTDVTETDFTFDSGDGKRFNVDGEVASKSRFLVFDGTVRPTHEVKYAFGDNQLISKDNYFAESEEVDLSDFKIVEGFRMVHKDE